MLCLFYVSTKHDVYTAVWQDGTLAYVAGAQRRSVINKWLAALPNNMRIRAQDAEVASPTKMHKEFQQLRCVLYFVLTYPILGLWFTNMAGTSPGCGSRDQETCLH